MKNQLFLAILALSMMMSCENPGTTADDTKDHNGIEAIPPGPESVQFPSLDDLPVYAAVYDIHSDAPVIVLCHQARFNKSEYNGIAEVLVNLGFNTIAIDQRSGGPIADYANQTVIEAKKKDLPTDYLDAEQDIIAAVNYAAKRFKGPVILWGSSYSATLALYVAESNKNVSAVISFSPGDYFKEEKGSLVDVLADFEKPMFVTSSNYESTDLNILMYSIGLNDTQIQFIPEGDGHHGSRALWPTQTGGEEYWEAIENFLEGLK